MAEELEHAFEGSIPEVYDRLMVPMIFAPYAADLADRVAELARGPLLEVAAGTGVLTRALAERLPTDVAITATDLNGPMLDQGALVGTSRPVEWRQGDVMALPFEDDTFGTVVCQFGAMFFPDRVAAFGEIRRVLRQGGVLVFNTWGPIEENDFARVVAHAVAEAFPEDPPTFVARIPHGYFDVEAIRSDLEGAGFVGVVQVEGLALASTAASAYDVATAFCQGTPLRNAVSARDPSRLDEVTARAAEAIEGAFGPGPVEGRMTAFVVTTEAT